LPESLFFKSNGSKVACHLYVSQKLKKAPGIVMCHGFAGVKELLLPNFAERFSSQGYSVLTFDYRGFGQSEGEAGRLIPALQIEDILNALLFMRSRPEVDPDRIGLWGTSFGGANAIYAAAQDRNVRCLSVQLTFGDGERVVNNGRSEEEKLNLYAIIEKMQAHKAQTGKEMMVPIHKVLSDPQSKEFYKQNVEQFPALKIKLPFLTLSETINHKPEQLIGEIKSPILITCASKDGVIPASESEILYEKASDPKELFIIKNATHYEVYSGDFFEQAIAKQLSWFDSYLKMGTN
jgi:fermentation-respiration switch protein FrsA (DUF1100 family)